MDKTNRTRGASAPLRNGPFEASTTQHPSLLRCLGRRRLEVRLKRPQLDGSARMGAGHQASGFTHRRRGDCATSASAEWSSAWCSMAKAAGSFPGKSPVGA